MNVIVSLVSERTGHRSLEQDRKVIQVLPYWGWVFVNIWHLQAQWLPIRTFTECNLTLDSVYSCTVSRHAVPSAQTTCDWWGENHHPKPNGPAKVSSLSECFLSLSCWIFNQWMILYSCVFVFVERTMRRLSLRCMKYMQWMYSSALERGRYDFDFTV